MRRGFLILLALAMLSGCAPVAQYAFSGAAASPKDAAYACILDRLTRAGYEIEKADRAAGVIEGRKATSHERWSDSPDAHLYDAITITLTDSPESGKSAVRGFLSTFVLQADGGRRPHALSKNVGDDTKALILECHIEKAAGAQPVQFY